MKNYILLLLTLAGFSTQAQDLIFIGDRAYKATPNWYFEGNGDQFKYYANNATIQVGKKGQSYIFSISTKVIMAKFSIKGAIRIYLDNATTIVLSKILSKDFSDDYSTVIYELSSSDLSKLKQSNINTIRFNSGLSGQLEGSTVSNRWDSNPDPIYYEVMHWDTSGDINDLITSKTSP